MTRLMLSRRDIFESPNTYIAHGTNTHGVMGAGIAALFAQRIDGLLEAYRERCARGDAVGTSYLFVTDTRVIVNVFSQDKPGPHARIEWLMSGLEDAVRQVPADSRLHMPWIGAGIGGLTRLDVACALREFVDHHDVAITVHELPFEATSDPEVLALFDGEPQITERS